MLWHCFIRSTTIRRNFIGCRPTLFLLTSQLLSLCQVCQNRVSQSRGSLQKFVFASCGFVDRSPTGILLIDPSTSLELPAAHRYRDLRAGTRLFAPARHSYKPSSATQLLQVHRKNSLPAACHRESTEQNSDSVIRNRTQRLHCQGPASSPAQHSAFLPCLHLPRPAPHGSETVLSRCPASSWKANTQAPALPDSIANPRPRNSRTSSLLLSAGFV